MGAHSHDSEGYCQVGPAPKEHQVVSVSYTHLDVYKRQVELGTAVMVGVPQVLAAVAGVAMRI